MLQAIYDLSKRDRNKWLFDTKILADLNPIKPA